MITKKKASSAPPRKLNHVGWREWVGLPALGVSRVKAKIDTGARTSALHVSHIIKIKGTKKIKFKIHPEQDERLPEYIAKALVIEYRNVKSSNGVTTLRPVIKTPVRMGQEEHLIEVTLVNRDMMGFRMLLGREAIRNKYLVDPGRSFLLPKKKKLKRKKLKKGEK